MRKLLGISLFAIAMGYMEAAVVVYLREIFYPEGFAFPLKLLTGKIAITEVFREFATLVMLAGIGYFAGKSFKQRFGAFLFSFGIWDLFYYIFLKLLIGWPESLLTWDILFLIPVTWVGPVLAPSINALTMCLLGGWIYLKEEQSVRIRIRLREWVMLVMGSLVILISYTQDYLRFILARLPLAYLFRYSHSQEVMKASESYIPDKFNWWLFGFGQLLLLIATFCIFNRKNIKNVHKGIR